MAEVAKKKRRRRPSLRNLHFKDKLESNKKLQISFGGCGFLGVYHIGVGKCVVDHAPHLFSDFDTFYGASAGAITAVWAACMMDPMTPYKWVRGMFDDSSSYWLRMFNPCFDLYSRLRDFLEQNLPKKAHRLCRNRVKISLTVVGQKGLLTNWLVTDFNTRKELINVIVASSFIPGYAGFRKLPNIRGKFCCDGGFTSNIPCISDPDVITVTPFAGFCDICPQGESCTQHMVNVCDQPMQLSPKNIYRLVKCLCPSSWEELEELFHQGYKDCLTFFRKEGLVADPVIQRRKPSIEPIIAVPSIAMATLRSNDPPNGNSFRHMKQNSLTLLSSGEFFSIDGGLEQARSSHLEFVEQGLDLRGTEKATNLTMKYGRLEVMTDDVERLRWRKYEEDVSVVTRLMTCPVKAILTAWNSLLWVWCKCSLRDVFRRDLPWSPKQFKLCFSYSAHDLSQLLSSEEDELSRNEGFLGRLISSYPSWMLSF